MDIERKSAKVRHPALAGASHHSAQPAHRGQGLTLATYKVASGARSPDPYNTSGSFDRTKNWARVGKR